MKVNAKMGRYNIRDNFEEVYLRINTVKKTLNTLPQYRIQEIIGDPHFMKCVKHMSIAVYNKNSHYFLCHGFTSEDMVSIGIIYGISFYASNYNVSDKKSEMKLLMRYLNQRLLRFVEWVQNKFYYQEKVSEAPADFSDPVVQNVVGSYNLHEDVYETDLTENLSVSDKILKIVNSIDLLTMQIKELKKTNMSKDNFNNIRSKLINNLKKLKSEYKSLKKKNKFEKYKNKKLIIKLRQKIHQNPHKYSNELAYYATSKHTNYWVRKKAREFCKKYGINYVEWAQNKINNGQIDRQELTF